MPVVDQTDVANIAIAHLPAKAIASIGENSLEAREARRFYPHVVADMLGGHHEWSFATQRAQLAALVTNDRENEWIYAYALPSNLANPIRVLPDLSSAGIGLPVPLPGDPYAESWAFTGSYFETPYIIDGATLYSNVQTATLEFTINDVAGLNVPQLVLTALALDLASRLCVPVKKDSEREKLLLTLANTAWERAIADDRNRQPQNQGEYISEAMAARRGYLTGMA